MRLAMDEGEMMTRHFLTSIKNAALLATGALLLSGIAANAAPATTGDRWLHVRVVSTDDKGETVSVNIPLEVAEKILPTINKNQLHGGKVTIDKFDSNGIDFRALLEAVRSSKDGEFVTVNSKDGEVRVAKAGGFMLVHVTDSSGKQHIHHHGASDADSKQKDSTDGKAAVAANVSHVEVKIPMSVVDALFSAGKDELDLVAGLKVLSAQGDTELVSVKDEESSVRVWIDSKNTNGSEGGSR
jgi:hypothetical protein